MDNGWDVFVMVGVTITFAGAFVVTFVEIVVVTFGETVVGTVVGAVVVITAVGTGGAGVFVGVGAAVCVVLSVATVVWVRSADPFVAFDEWLNPGIMPEKDAPMMRKIMTTTPAARPHFSKGPRPFFCTGNSLP